MLLARSAKHLPKVNVSVSNTPQNPAVRLKVQNNAL